MTIAIIIPAFNEELTIEQVITDFYKFDSSFEIYVIDNNSSDGTRKIAIEVYDKLQCKGKILIEKRQGKALAVKQAFSKIDADFYVMIDADSTYSVEDLSNLMQPILDGRADMVVGNRHYDKRYQRENTRLFHNFGNSLVRLLINFFFNANLSDILSGYRCFSKKFVKNYPILCDGFALETDLTLHALDKGFSITEIPIQYKDRPSGSESKLNTFQDGFIVLSLIFKILKNYKPFYFFGLWSLVFFCLGIIFGSFPIFEYFNNQYISRVPLAILATGLMIFSIISFAIGLILQSNVENHRFMYALKLLHWGK